MGPIEIILMVVALFVGPLILLALTAKLCYHHSSPGQATILSRAGGQRKVAFAGHLRLPLIDQATAVDLTMRTLWETWDANHPLATAERDDATLDVTFNVHIPATEAAVLQAVDTLGPAPSDTALAEAFRERFRVAVETTAKSRTVNEIFADQMAYGEAVHAALPASLDGFAVHSVNVHAVGPSPDEAPP